eukprot:2737126-Rhodomonas_salina.1
MGRCCASSTMPMLARCRNTSPSRPRNCDEKETTTSRIALGVAVLTAPCGVCSCSLKRKRHGSFSNTCSGETNARHGQREPR